MSLHFGLYSVAARGEWVRSVEELTVEEYQRYFETFNPEPGWAVEWARLARQAGARYAVLTTKHHDGFCLFDSGLTDYKATNTPARRDLGVTTAPSWNGTATRFSQARRRRA